MRRARTRTCAGSRPTQVDVGHSLQHPFGGCHGAEMSGAASAIVRASSGRGQHHVDRRRQRAASPDGTSLPDTPSWISSSIPPTSVEMTGVPSWMAS